MERKRRDSSGERERDSGQLVVCSEGSRGEKEGGRKIAPLNNTDYTRSGPNSKSFPPLKARLLRFV